MWGESENFMSKTDEKSSKRQKFRYWMVTGFDEEPQFDQFTMSCMRVGKEICPQTKSDHWHASIQFHGYVSQATVKQVFPKANLTIKKGNYTEFFAYSKKDGDFKDYGVLMHNNQGERTDLVELIEAVDAGKPLYELLREFPVFCSKSLNYVMLLF